MSLRPHTATINATSVRAEVWRRIFGGDTVQIRSPVTSKMTIDGLGERDCYLVVPTEEQLDRVLSHVVETFGLPPEEVRAEIQARGIPVLADDITVCMDLRYFI